jgi:hypothetical protein
MILATDESVARLLDRRHKPVEPSNSFCAFCFRLRGPTERDEEIRTEGASDFPSLERLVLTIASIWDRGSQAWHDCRRRNGRIDVRTVRATLLSVDEVLRFAGRASAHAVPVELSFRHDTASSMGSAAAVQEDCAHRARSVVRMECAALGSMRR